MSVIAHTVIVYATTLQCATATRYVTLAALAIK